MAKDCRREDEAIERSMSLFLDQPLSHPGSWAFRPVNRFLPEVVS